MVAVSASDLSEYQTLSGTGNYPGKETIADALGVIKPLAIKKDSVDLIEQFLKRKEDLLDLADDVHELRNFYTSQRPAWDQLLEAKQRFKANRGELEQEASAGNALAHIQQILDAPAPYGMVKEAAGLIQQIAQVNDALITAHRGQVLPAVDRQLGKVQVERDAAQADHDLRNQCLYSLQQLKKQVESLTSLAHIDHAAGRAVDLADQAFAKLEEAIKPTAKKPGGRVNDATPPKPYVKPRRVIKPSALAPEGYLETQAEIDAYLDKLGGAMEKVIAAGYRIEIRQVLDFTNTSSIRKK